MKNKLLFTLILSSLMAVTSCGDAKNDTPNTDNNGGGDIVEPEVINAWSSQEKALMHEYLNGHEVPYVPITGAKWVYDQNLNLLCYQKPHGTLDDINNFLTGIIGQGFSDISSEENGCPSSNPWNHYVYKALDNTAKHEEMYLFITRYMKSEMFSVEVEYYIDSVWDEDAVNEAINLVYGTNDKLPVPNFTYQSFILYSVEPSWGQVEIHLISQDYTQAYYQQCIELGWKMIEDTFFHTMECHCKDGKMRFAITYEENMMIYRCAAN